MIKIIKTAGMLVYNENKVLLVKHKEGAKHQTGVYGLPAGSVEKNESKINTAIRELKEETGLLADKNKVIKIPNFI
ncbi:MAG: NUDIX hydrolase [Patescibacteria group bacterium]